MNVFYNFENKIVILTVEFVILNYTIKEIPQEPNSS